MTAKSKGNESAVIQGAGQGAPRPVAPPEYRQRALRSVINNRRRQGANSLSLSELVCQLQDPKLRKDSDPRFEPLSFESIEAAVKDLVGSRELKVDGRTVVFGPSTPRAD